MLIKWVLVTCVTQPVPNIGVQDANQLPVHWYVPKHTKGRKVIVMESETKRNLFPWNRLLHWNCKVVNSTSQTFKNGSLKSFSFADLSILEDAARYSEGKTIEPLFKNGHSKTQFHKRKVRKSTLKNCNKFFQYHWFYSFRRLRHCNEHVGVEINADFWVYHHISLDMLTTLRDIQPTRIQFIGEYSGVCHIMKRKFTSQTKFQKSQEFAIWCKISYQNPS